MTPLRFHAARMLRQDALLATLSVSPEALLADLSGQRVALVGNARALAETRFGAEIDAHDLVIRINRAPAMTPESHGTRTDWLALATRLGAADRARLSPDRILWMSHKRKRLDWASAHSPGFYLHPLASWQDLAERLGAPPSTGAMLVDLLAGADYAALDLYGFDFMQSASLSGRRRADQVPHDFAAEAEMIRARLEADPRIRLIA